jgi:drug/metabolite transporter (DMT)-like permease
LGYAFISLAAVLWGIIGLITGYVFAAGATPLTYAALRPALSAGLIFLAIAVIRPRLLRVRVRDIAFFALFGLVSIGVFYFCLFYAVQKTSVTVAWILLYTAPAYVVVLSRVFLHEPITRVKWLSLVLTVVGSALVSGVYDLSGTELNGLGIAAGLMAGLTYGLYSFFGRKANERYDTWTSLLYSFAFGSLFLLALWFPTAGTQVAVAVKIWPLLLATTVISTIVPYGLYLYGLTMVETGKASITANLEPVTAMLLAYFVLRERVSWIQFGGAALVIGGVVAIQLSDIIAGGRRRRAERGAESKRGVGP